MYNKAKEDGFFLPERNTNMNDPLEKYKYACPQDKISKPENWKSLHTLTRNSCKFGLTTNKET